jgi:hypothetical protein
MGVGGSVMEIHENHASPGGWSESGGLAAWGNIGPNTPVDMFGSKVA